MRPLLLLPLIVTAAPALGQEVPPAEPPAGEASPESLPLAEEDVEAVGDEILVVATRLRGQVDAPQAPIMTLEEEDIEAYGAASLGDLIAQLGPQTGSGRGRGGGHPVMLLNGRRISSFREMRDLPPEAIRRMEILPEEVALRYGYPPNQRVVNFILKENFSSKTVAVEYEPATRGGTADSELEAGLVRIDGQKRLNITGKINDTTMLTEAERDVIQPEGNVPTIAGDPDPARFRSLVDDSRSYALNGTWSTGLGEGPGSAALTVNAAVTRSESRSLSGLDTVLLRAPDGSTALRSLPDPLTRSGRNTQFEGGLVFNKPVAGWQLTATADASHTRSETRVDRRRDLSSLVAAAAAGTLPIDGPLPAVTRLAPDRSLSKDLALTSLVTAVGNPFRLPAGEASMTLKAGFGFSRSDNSDTRSAGRVRLQRSDLSAGVNLGLPVTSRREGVLGAIGDVSLNFSAGINHLSDFGTLNDWSAGLTWEPTEKLSLQASYIVNEAAPSLQSLGNPVLPSFNVPVFDFARGETVLVTTLHGGNPDLRRETQRDLKLSANWELPFLANSNLLVEYFRNRSSDVTQDLPLLTPEIEAAFPDRVVRDAAGRLVSIDRRPVTFSEVKSSRLRWGFNLSGTIGKPRPAEGAGAAGSDGPRGPRMGRGGAGGGPRMGHGGGGRGGFGGGRGGTGQGRWNLSLIHKLELSNTVLVAPGGPLLDLLDGDALSAGGVARHGLQLEGGAFYRGFGLRFNGNWNAPVTLRGSGAPGTTDLRFGSTFKLNLRAFVNFDQQRKLVEDVPFLKGSRLAIKVDNLFDARQRVTDASGEVPLSYQPAYRDPRGRVIGVDFRKMF